MDVTGNIETCHRCALANGTLHKGRCPLSQRQFLAHAEADYCPMPKPQFGKGLMPLAWESEGLGDTIKKATSLPGVRRVVPKGCGGCVERQKKWNERFPYGE